MTLPVEDYLQAYDAQLRTDAQTPSAIAVEQLGPLRLMTFAGGRGFVTCRDLAGADATTIGSWVHQTLVGQGFRRQEAESIMIGEAALLDLDVPLPASVRLRRVDTEADVRAMSAMQDVAFGDPVSNHMAEAVLRRLEREDGMELWVAEAAGQTVGAGRLEPVEGSDFAGIWGGAVLAGWRGQGVYRALTAVRARSALTLGKTLIHSDSTACCRPILERSGLVAVSTTKPYEWRRTVSA